MKITAANWAPVIFKAVMMNPIHIKWLKFLLSSLITDTYTILNTMTDTALSMK